MQPSKLPANVAAVADSFQEAAGYESLQMTRRRGAYGAFLGAGLAGLGLVPIFAPGAYLTIFLFAMAFLVLIFATAIWMRQRPDWQKVFYHPEMPKERLLRNPLYWIAIFVQGLVFRAVEATDDLSGAGPSALQAVAAGQIVLSAADMAFFAWLMRDRAVRGAALGSALLAVPVALGSIPPLDAIWAWFAVVGGAMLVVGMVRLLGPRRWLVR